MASCKWVTRTTYGPGVADDLKLKRGVEQQVKGVLAKRNRTGPLESFGKPPFILFEWMSFERMWFYLHQHPRQLAQALVKIGWPIIFIPAPSRYVQTSDGLELEQVEFGIWRSPVWRHDGHQIKLNLTALAELFPDSPWVFRHPNWMPLVESYDFSGRLVAYDRSAVCIDDESDPDVNAWERRLAASSDLVITNSVPGLIKWKRLNERTMYLRNASLPIRHLEPSAEARELDRIARPRLLVLNSFGNELDLDLIEFTAEERPNWSLVIIGSQPDERFRWPDKPNIYYLGERLYAELPMYTRYCDVGLVPLKQQSRTVELNPLIVNDYRAADVPVVTTYLPELLHTSDSRLHVTSDRQSFLSSIESVLSRASERDKAAATIEYSSTWQQQAQQFVHFVYAETSPAHEKDSYESAVARYYETLKHENLEERSNPLATEELTTAAYANGRYSDVLELGNPSMPVLGCALVRLAKFERARAWLQDYADRAGHDDRSLVKRLDAASLRAYIYTLNGEFAEALRVLADVGVKRPVHHLLAARLWFQLGFRDNATHFYGETMGEDPSLLRSGDYLNIGDLMLEQGRLRDAEEAYLQASLLGASADAQQKLAELYEQIYAKPETATSEE